MIFIFDEWVTQATYTHRTAYLYGRHVANVNGNEANNNKRGTQAIHVQNNNK